MVKPSSTSPSDPPAAGRGLGSRWPWAATLAIGLLGALEFVVRLVDPVKLMTYDVSEVKVPYLRMVQQNLPTPDIAIFGTSKVLHNVIAPVLQEELELRTGRELRVRNYAICGLLADQLDAAVEYMLKLGRHPQLTMIGVSPFLFWTDPADVFSAENRGRHFADPHDRRTAIMWDLPEFIAARREYGSDVDRFLGTVIRNEIGNYYHSFRYRDLATGCLRQLKRSLQGTSLSNPMLGEKWSLHVESPNADETNLPIRWPMCDEAGRFFDDGEKPRLFRRMLRAFRERGLQVVLFEMPDHPTFRAGIPDRAFAQFRELMQSLTEEFGYPYLTLDALGLAHSADEWRDILHLNYRGAYRTTRVLATRLPIAGIWPVRPDYRFEPDQKPR